MPFLRVGLQGYDSNPWQPSLENITLSCKFYVLDVDAIQSFFQWKRGADVPQQCAYISLEHTISSEPREHRAEHTYFAELQPSNWIRDVVDLKVELLDAKRKRILDRRSVDGAVMRCDQAKMQILEQKKTRAVEERSRMPWLAKYCR